MVVYLPQYFSVHHKQLLQKKVVHLVMTWLVKHALLQGLQSPQRLLRVLLCVSRSTLLLTLYHSSDKPFVSAKTMSKGYFSSICLVMIAQVWLAV